MGKLVRVVVVGGALLLLVAGLSAWFLLINLDAIVKRTVERVGSETTGTTVGLDGARISIKSTEGALDGLRIANPPGFDSPTAFELHEILLNLDLATIRSDEIVLREVAVRGAHLTFEQKGGSNNLQALLDHVEQIAAGETSEAGADDEARMVIEKFTFQGGRMTLIHEQLGDDLSFEIPDLTIEDIGRVGAGETMSSVAQQILEPVLRRAMDAAQDKTRAILEQRLDREIEKQRQIAVDSLKDRLLSND